MPNLRTFVGINRHLQDEQVALYVDALKLNKTEKLPAEVRRHVAQCQACRKNITELYSLLIDEDYSRSGTHPFFDGAELKRSWFPGEFVRMAAAIVALVGVALVVYYIGVVRKVGEAPPSIAVGSHVSADSSSQKSEPLHQPTQQSAELIAGRFEAWPPLEDMVNTEFRSGSLEAVTPKNGETFSTKDQNIAFAWKGYSGNDVTLTIMDNKGKSVYSSPVDALPFVAANVFPAGLYYWKIQNNAELMHVGKFRVK